MTTYTRLMLFFTCFTSMALSTQALALGTNMGFHFPADFEPHQAVWVSWPDYSYIQHNLSAQEQVEVEIIRALTRHVMVKLNVHPEKLHRVENILRKNNIPLDKVIFYTIPYVDIWTRDWGPIYVVNDMGGKKIVDFQWSNWGLPDAFSDPSELLTGEEFDKLVAEQEGLQVIQANIVSEGGNRDVNGLGTMLTIERTELQRNPGMTKEQLEAEYQRVLGVKKVIWLKRGVIDDNNPYEGLIPGPDGTNSAYTLGGEHIDDLARFVNPHTIVLPIVTQEEADRDPLMAENKRRLDENYAILSNATDQDGNPFTIVRMPIAETEYHIINKHDEMYKYLAMIDFIDGSTFPYPEPVYQAKATNYMNFFVTNGLVLGQKYWKPGMPDIVRQKDEQVEQILQSLFPDREIVMLDNAAINIIGGVHCATQQDPWVQ